MGYQNILRTAHLLDQFQLLSGEQGVILYEKECRYMIEPLLMEQLQIEVGVEVAYASGR